MKSALIALLLLLLPVLAPAAWYWPFGSDDDDEDDVEKPRLSELMEPATTNIDAAADYAAEGKYKEAQASYRAALAALDAIERDTNNIERVATPEFATVRNKRAYISAAMDAMLLAEARENAKAVAVTDTTALERELREKKAAKEAAKAKKDDGRGLVVDEGDDRPEVESQLEKYMAKERKHNRKVANAATKEKTRKGVQRTVRKLLKEDPKSRKARLLMAGEDLRGGDFASAREKVEALLAEKPKDAAALNLRAAIEAAEGNLTAAENTLDQAIQSNPKDYHGYYNMANVYLEKGNANGARKYYETGRVYGGPKDAALEKAVKK